MIKILTLTFYYNKNSTGGAATSFLNIVDGLNKHGNFQIQNVFFRLNKNLGKLLNATGIGFNIFIPKIIKKIRDFKPHLIITQKAIALPSIISANIMNVPVINIIRDTTMTCPKYINIIDYGKSCSGLKKKKICFNCINYWRSLRVLIAGKSKEREFSLKTSFLTVFYKMKYIFTRLNFLIMNYATINIVASNLLKSILSTKINPKKIRVANITPIKRIIVPTSVEKKNWILFLIPIYEESHKGLEFVLRLAEFIPANYKFVIVGRKIILEDLSDIKSKVINLGYVIGEKLDRLFQESKITIIPTFCTEAFGRVIIESLINKTPVITSPNCGANQYFEDKKFLKIVPLKLPLWVKTIRKIINNPPKINEHDVTQIYHQFSMERSIKDLLNVIRSLKN